MVLSKEAKKQRAIANKKAKEYTQETFFLLLDQVGIERPTPEFIFHKERKWRCDYCWIDQKIILEVEGGIHIGGRHSRGMGMKEDMNKYNEAAIYGYRILKVVPKELCSFNTLNLLRRILIFN